MFLNYLKVAIRNILKYKIFSLINIFGLALAMSICMLIIMMLADQKSYDQFNTNKDNIFRILSDKTDFRNPYATSPFPLSGALKENTPIIKATTHLLMGVGGDAVYNQHSTEMRGYFADPSFFNVFSFELEKGDKQTALVSPNSIVITAETARRLFDNDNPIGKTIAFTDRGLYIMGEGEASAPTSWGNYTITGVIDKKQYKSHLKFDALVSASSIKALSEAKKFTDLSNNWNNYYNCYTYVMLNPSRTSADLDAVLSRLASLRYADNPELKGFKLFSQPLTKISPGMILGNEPQITLPMVVYYFLSFLALVIMISACLNYTNLSIARALSRAREIGIRKVNGALRKNLIFQFLCESTLMAFLALVLALVLLLIVRAAFLGLWANQYLHFDLSGGLSIYLAFAAFALLVGLFSGLYPALYLSKFQPIKALKNGEKTRPGKLRLRKILSISQFAISLIFIITSILIFNQSRHFLTFKFEFNSGNIINVDLQSNDYRIAARELGAVRGVSGISACSYIPVTGRSEGTGLKRVGIKEEPKHLMQLQIDENFVDNLALRLVAGRSLPAGNTSGRQVLVNEAAVKEFGYRNPAEIIGQTFEEGPHDTASLEVIGVVEDFHMALDRDKIEPMVLKDQPGKFKYVNIKIAAGDTRSTVARLENKWKIIDPVHPFKYQFFDDQLAATAQGFFDIVSILGFLAFLAITIACLGMLGMATYTTERRMKEVGIRKALGAENFGIVLMLSKEFIKILVIAILIAAPLSFILNTLWLRKFPNRVDFGLGTVLVGILFLLVLGLLTIGSQTIRASKCKPVDSLRME
jgi:putative ABC transport system permease protein